MTTRQVQLSFLFILLCVMGVSGHLGYRLGKRAADRWWQDQSFRGPDIEYEKDYDVVLRGFYIEGNCTFHFLDSKAIRTLAADNAWEINENKPCHIWAKGKP